MSGYMTMLIILFFIFLFSGVPVLFALGLPCVFWLFLHPALKITIIAQNMMLYMTSFTLIAMPGFLFVGRLMNYCGITDKLFRLSIATVGRFRGGMAHANCLASALFASMSGSAIADAGGLGIVEMRMMKRAGYKADFSAGITASSSVLGPIIPPSLAMVAIGTIGEIPVGQMFFAGVIPGILLCGALMIQVGLRAMFTKEGRNWPRTIMTLKQSLLAVLDGIPALFTFGIIMGSIWLGICTPTEAAVVAAVYSIVLGIFYHKITPKTLWDALKATAAAIGPLTIIMSAASIFTWILMIEGLPQMVTSIFAGFSGDSGQVVVMCISVVIFLIIGCFIDSGAAVLILAPIIIPVVKAVGIDPVQFGVVMTLSLIIGVITPPYGICLFVVAGVAKLPVWDVTKEAVRYLPAMLVILLLLMFWPDMVLFLPRVLLNYAH
jgi:tripartite ATP-independent transporter DctM subunit